MDHCKAKAGAPKPIASLSNVHHESVPMSSEHAETQSCIGHPENDAQLDDQFVLIDYESFEVYSLSNSSESSFDELENDLDARSEEGLGHPSNTPDQDSSATHPANFVNNDNKLELSGACSPSELSPESSAVYTPSNYSTTSNPSHLLHSSSKCLANKETPAICNHHDGNRAACPDSAGSDASHFEESALSPPAPEDIAPVSNEASGDMQTQRLIFMPIEPPPPSYYAPSLRHERFGQNNSVSLKHIDECSIEPPWVQHMLDCSYTGDLRPQQQQEQMPLSNCTSFRHFNSHAMDDAKVEVAERGGESTEETASKVKDTTAVDENTFDDYGRQPLAKVAHPNTRPRVDQLGKEGVTSPTGQSRLVVNMRNSVCFVSTTDKYEDGMTDEVIANFQMLEDHDLDEEQAVSSIVMTSVSSLKTQARRLTRHCQISLATMFDYTRVPPEEHFPVQTMRGSIPHSPRYINRWNDREIMLVTDGSCVPNGAVEARNTPSECEPSAGASFIYRPDFGDQNGSLSTYMPFQAIDQARCDQESASGGSKRQILPLAHPVGNIGLRLEAQGARGDVQKHTSNRAKLRAVIAALQFRPWHAEGWKRVVVVTNLEYIAFGATKWIALWAKRRWRSAPSWTREGKMRLGKKIANRDLWEELQSRIDTLGEYGTEVSFWLVPDSLNSPLLREAKAAARDAARFTTNTVVVEEYTKLVGVGM